MTVGEFQIPPCPHNQPFSGVVTITASTAIACIFCERDKLQAELAAMTKARDEACDGWQAHLDGAIKRGGMDGGYRLEQARLDAVRAIGKEPK